MKKVLIGITGILIVLVAAVGAWPFFNAKQSEYIYASASALYGSDNALISEDEKYAEGTEQNPFVILEVVPYEGYAEIGYMIQGCEPVPMDIVKFNKADGALVISSTEGMSGTWVDEYTYELPSGDYLLSNFSSPVSLNQAMVPAITNLPDLGKWRYAGAAEYGYYEKVTTGSGTYYQEKRSINGAEAVVYVKATASYPGNYNWIPYADSTKNDGIHTPTDMWMVDDTWGKDRIDTYRSQFYRGKYNISYGSGSNKFLMKVLGLTESQIPSYKVQVLTITPGQLSEQTDLIDKVDLISFAPDSHYYYTTTNSSGATVVKNDMVDLWEKYHSSKKAVIRPVDFDFNTTGVTQYTKTCNDLTWEATVKVLEKAAVDNNRAPIIFDATGFTEDNSYNWNNGSKNDDVIVKKAYSTGTAVGNTGAASYTESDGYFNNIAKLYLVMEQMDPAKFYNEYIRTGLIVPVKVVNSEIHDADENIYTGDLVLTTGCYKEQLDTPSIIPTECDIKWVKFRASAVVWSIHTFLPYNLFKNEAALLYNQVWETVGIDNYLVIDSTIGNTSVQHNIYTYDGDKALTKDLTTSEILYNKYTKDAFEYFGKSSTDTLTPAEAIQYLLRIQSALTYDSETVRILEIEPCKDFIWNGTAVEWSIALTNDSTLDVNKYGTKYARQFFAKFVPHFTGKIIITTMTSSEFIGDIDDLNTTYDMIFFGLNTGRMNTDASGRTLYNDTTLNGLVYSHNGDRVILNHRKLEGLDDDNGDDTYRFSGNDITNLKYLDLIDFMKAGYPIVFNTGFYHSTNYKAVNVSSIDRNSNIYNLVNLINSGGIYAEQMFSVDGFDGNGLSILQLEEKISASKCRIVFGDTKGTLDEKNCKPVTYKDKTLDSTLTDSQIYINGNNQAFRTLQYKFYISDASADPTDTYTVKLYVDVNADGKYDDETENMSGLQVMNEANYVINYKKLKPGVNYTVSRTLEADYYGVLPWKLEVISNNNSEIRDSVIDYCALRTETSNKIDLYILQIMSNSGNNLDLEDAMTNSSSKFYNPLRNVSDYNIHIVSWTVSEFANICQAARDKYHSYQYILSDDNDYNASGKNNSYNDDGDDYYDFDMLIMGFADCYSDIGSSLALQNIDDFIEEGKSVLFTHDTTSFVNMPEAQYKNTYGFSDFWGYGLNSNFRSVFGMDRFGVTLTDSNPTDTIDIEDIRSEANKDYAKKDTLQNKLYSGYIQGYSNIILNRYATKYLWTKRSYSRDVRFWTELPASVHYRLLYADYNWRGEFQYGDYRMFYDETSTLQYMSHKYSLKNDFETDLKTTKATITNKGQITVYPYTISDTIDVAETHAQYYQLDLENDNIVVWYCLSDNNSNGLYSSTPNDVRNNYYIYNVGNITYSGVGHSSVNSVMEAKLFVNTMIGSYTATAKDPSIKITNDYTSFDGTTNNVYVNYDIYDTDLAVGSDVTAVDNSKDPTISSSLGTVNAQLVKFRVDDYNILFNKKMYVNFYDDPSGAKSEHLYYMVNTNGTDDTSDDIRMTSVKVDNVFRYQIDAGEEYAIAVPLTWLNVNNETYKIGINVMITYGKTSTKTKLTEASFQLVRRGLFDLE